MGAGGPEPKLEEGSHSSDCLRCAVSFLREWSVLRVRNLALGPVYSKLLPLFTYSNILLHMWF